MNDEADEANAMTHVVVLPGLDGTGELLERFVQRAPGGTQVEVLAYPLDEALGYAALAERLRDRLPNRGCVLIGESFGGPLAVRLADLEPDRVRAVVLAGSFVTSPAPSAARLIPWSLVFRLPFQRALARRVVGSADEESLDQLRAVLRRVAPPALAARMREVVLVDERDACARLTQPLLALHADRDRLVPDRCADQLRAVRPEVTEVRLDTHHALLQLAPDAAWRAIFECLRDRCDGASS